MKATLVGLGTGWRRCEARRSDICSFVRPAQRRASPNGPFYQALGLCYSKFVQGLRSSPQKFGHQHLASAPGLERAGASPKITSTGLASMAANITVPTASVSMASVPLKVNTDLLSSSPAKRFPLTIAPESVVAGVTFSLSSYANEINPVALEENGSNNMASETSC